MLRAQGGYSLYTQTLPAPLGEGDDEPVEALALLGCADPALRVEGFGIREDGRVHVDEVGGLADGGLALCVS